MERCTSCGREKKIRKIQRSTQSSHDDNDRSDHQSSSYNIPHDLIVEILSRLRAKPLVRFRSVSKLWSSITTDPVFINSFETKSSPCTLLIFRKHRKLFVFSSQPQKNRYPPQKEYCRFTIPKYCYLKRYDSVHGLICLETSTQLMLWNPTTRCLFTLPKPEFNEHKLGYVLGYDPIDVKYRALCILSENKIGILTLGAQESWRILSIGSPKHAPTTYNCRCINGVIYYVAFICSTLNHGIMSFDLRSEKLSLINCHMHDLYCFLASYEGRLALVKSIDSGVELWVLMDAENHKRICKHFTLHHYRKCEY